MAVRRIGKVYLVGAGPGDPELLTVKALRLLGGVDVVVYDRLVSAAILDLVPAGVSRIGVGKRCGDHGLAQDEISRRLVRLARSGRDVARLKGGDPFIFGRGGEEALALRRHGISFEVVPGITAASACAAYAGIPLTHRGASSGVRLVTGHLRDDGRLDFDWRALADPDCTLAVYMGLAAIDTICRRLMEAGLAAETPAAAIQDGTMASQRRVLGALGALPALVATAGLRSPVLLVIGRVAALADDLDWFDPMTTQAALGNALVPVDHAARR